MSYRYFETKLTTDSIMTSFRKEVWILQNTTDLYHIYYAEDNMFRPLYKMEDYSVYIH